MSRSGLSDEERLLRELRNLKQFPPMPGVPENAPGISAADPFDSSFSQSPQFLRFSGRQQQEAEPATPGVSVTRGEVRQAPDFIFGAPGEERPQRSRPSREPDVARPGIPIEVSDARPGDSSEGDSAQIKELLQRILVEIENLPDEMAQAFGVDL